jgi:hypothetical protein
MASPGRLPADDTADQPDHLVADVSIQRINIDSDEVEN